MTTALTVPNAFRITEKGITVQREPTFDEWLSDTTLAIRLRKAWPFVIGDFLVYGQQHWPDKYHQAIDDLLEGYEIPTLMNYQSTCLRVPPAVRRPELGISLHEAVACLPVENQEELLTHAATLDHGRREWLRQQAKLLREPGYYVPAKIKVRAKRAFWEMRGTRKALVLEDVFEEEGTLPQRDIKATIEEE